jgi:Ca2+-binding RTX toxin-like protein
MAKIVLSGSDFVDLLSPDMSGVYAASTGVYQSNTLAIVSTGSNDLVMEGSGFTSFDSRGYPTAGTVTGIGVVFEGSGRAQWSDFSVDAHDLETAIRNGDTNIFIDLMWGGNDKITLNEGGGGISGFDGDDKITGKAGFDVLHGGNGNDVIKGGGADDVLVGGAGKDTLAGGAGVPDRFVYLALADSAAGGIDTIADLESSDTIDIESIDADTSSGADDGFTIVGAFSGMAGELVLNFQSGQNRTRIAGDSDGDGNADLIIYATGDHEAFTNFFL